MRFSNTSAGITSPVLYFSVSPSTNGNSSIFEKALLLDPYFPSAQRMVQKLEKK